MSSELNSIINPTPNRRTFIKRAAGAATLLIGGAMLDAPILKAFTRTTPPALNFGGQFIFISAHGRLLQAHTDGEMHASQEVEHPGEEERWNVYIWPDGKISLQNFRTNRWLCAEPSGKAIADRAAPNIWEQWTLHGVDGTHVALKSYHNKWLCAQPPGQDTQYGGEVIADRANCAAWERFSMIPSPGIPVSNQSWWNDVLGAVKVAAQVVPILIGG